MPGHRLGRTFSALPTALVALVASAGGAAAQTPALAFRPCGSPHGFACASLTVPVDRADAAAGTLQLAVRRLPAVGAYRGTMVFLAGGPGQAGIAPGGDLERGLQRSARGYEVVAIDQRGTGATALACPAAASLTAATAADGVTACADELGTSRLHHGTADTVADLEDLRIALGREAITPFGVSYGTLVATWYARTYPARTAGLILDSVVSPQGDAAVEPDAYSAARRALAELCGGTRCRGVTRDPSGDVARLEARLATEPLRGVRVSPTGRARADTFGGPDAPTALFQAFAGGDLSPAARGAFPAAVAMGLRGDPALLFRITPHATGPDRPRVFSVALFLATACGESRLPWTGDQSLADRRAAATAALAALDPSVTAPFNRPGLDSPLVAACLGWPQGPVSAPPEVPLPDVPVLVINGTQDTRTPMEAASLLVGGLPRASLVRAEGSGHSSITARSQCALLAIRRFTANIPVGQPCAAVQLPPITTPPPATFGALRPLRLPGRRGRTLRAVVVTLQDVQQAIEFGTGAGATVRFAGLRAGSGTVRVTGRGVVVRFTRYTAIPGVRVTGRVVYDGVASTAVLHVGGGVALPSHLRLTGKRMTGTVGGVAVDVTR